MNCLNRFLKIFLRKWLICTALIFSLLISQVSATALEHSSPSASDILRLGTQQLQIGEYLEAVSRFTQAIELNKDFTAAYSNRCLAYLQLQDYQNAIADCNQAIKLAPHNIETYINRGIAYYRQGDYPAAINDNNRVIANKPHDFRAYYNRGVATAALGHNENAILDYHRALSLIPQTESYLLADIYNDLGLARFHLTDFNAATRNFTLAIRLNPQDYRGYFNRGCTCGKNGDNIGAVRDFSATVNFDPSNALAYVNRGIAYHNLGYEQAAISDLKIAATYFGQQGQQIAYQKTLDLIKVVQRQIPAIEETG